MLPKVVFMIFPLFLIHYGRAVHMNSINSVFFGDSFSFIDFAAIFVLVGLLFVFSGFFVVFFQDKPKGGSK